MGVAVDALGLADQPLGLSNGGTQYGHTMGLNERDHVNTYNQPDSGNGLSTDAAYLIGEYNNWSAGNPYQGWSSKEFESKYKWAQKNNDRQAIAALAHMADLQASNNPWENLRNEASKFANSLASAVSKSDPNGDSAQTNFVIKSNEDIAKQVTQQLNDILGLNARTSGNVTADPIGAYLGLPQGYDNMVEQQRQLVLRGTVNHFMNMPMQAVTPKTNLSNPNKLQGV